MQTGHGAEDRREDQWHDDHLQQLHITVADQIEPTDGGFENRVASAINGMQDSTEQHAEHQADQNFLGQAPVAMTGLGQA
ncbi:hypothetical protein D3C81_1444110 [compost metagenome]